MTHRRATSRRGLSTALCEVVLAVSATACGGDGDGLTALDDGIGRGASRLVFFSFDRLVWQPGAIGDVQPHPGGQGAGRSARSPASS